MSNELLVLTGPEVLSLLDGREEDILDMTGRAYVTHRRGHSNLPNSKFLRFPDNDRNRIIALPAYVGEEFAVAGIKWIASFPGNVDLGMERASAVLILNSPETGHAQAVMESSIISARRTAASAALGAKTLHAGKDMSTLGLIGGGPINFEITRFTKAACPALSRLVLCDLSQERAEQFKARAKASFGLECEIVPDFDSVLKATTLVSFGTTAGTPWVKNIDAAAPGTTLLHISLRDLPVSVIETCDNIVDDVDHVLNANTSVHLMEQKVGHRNFIRATLADILDGAQPARISENGVVAFTPFGMGTLDMALAKFVLDAAKECGAGTKIPDFLPEPWMKR